jgi:hypothetical protein
MRNLAWIMLMMALTAGCGGKGVAPPTVDPGTPAFATALDAAKLARLPATVNAAVAEIRGSVKLNGMTLLSDTGVPVPGSTAYGTILVRLVDPGDDILSVVETNPDASGDFSFEVAGPPRRGVLELRFRVQADLDGDGTSGDTVRQRFVLGMAAGKASVADFVLTQQTGLQPGAPAQGTPPQVIAAQITALDVDGKHVEFRASDFTAGQLVVDVDGDAKFDPLRDLTLADADNNSLPDASATLYARTSGYERLFGLVTRVDEFKREIDILVKDSAETSHSVTIVVDALAAVELYLPKEHDPAAQFAQLNLGQFMVGRSVYADGYFTDGATQRALTAFALTVLQPQAQ